VITGDRTDDLIGQALAAGADDFIYKPINHKELLARMQARLEELTRREAKEILAFGDISMDLAHRSIHKNTNIRYVSPTEMNLLSCLVQARGGVVRRETLKRRCWGQVFVSDNALNRKLHEVRKALKDIASDLQIRTIYGTGFTVEMSPDSAEALCAQGK
jgi:DNA-binding response OmpR family regulator